MGVHHLRTFMCKFAKDGYCEVNIRDAIISERKRTGNNPLIVIDVIALTMILYYQNTKDLLCGGRNAMYAKIINYFLTELRSLGAELVFYSTGLTDLGKPLEKYVIRGKSEYAKTIQTLDKISDGIDLSRLTNPKYNYTKNELPPINTFKYSMITICSKYGPVYFSIEHNREKLMTSYATKYGALAIIGDNSNFLIYDGNWRYWCAKDLEIKSMTIMEFSRIELRRITYLRNSQLPLFAACCGNDFVDYHNIVDFHKRIGDGRWKIFNLAQYVRQYGCPYKLPKNILKDITADVFGDYTKENFECIQQSLDLYNNQYVEEDYKEYQNYIERWLYDVKLICIVYGDIFRIRNIYFDYRQTEYPSYSDIMLPIVQRQMGVLLKHKNDPELKRTVLIKRSHETDSEEIEILPIYPKIKQLGNDELHLMIYRTHSDKMEKRWKILLWLISDSLQKHGKKLKALPKYYLCSCLTLYYLVELKLITIWEADIIFLAINGHYENRIPDKIQYPRRLTTRATILSCLFTKLYVIILRCINLAGLHDYMELLTFDGVYYHNLMQELCEAPEDIRKTSIREIKPYRIYSLK